MTIALLPTYDQRTDVQYRGQWTLIKKKPRAKIYGEGRLPWLDRRPPTKMAPGFRDADIAAVTTQTTWWHFGSFCSRIHYLGTNTARDVFCRRAWGGERHGAGVVRETLTGIPLTQDGCHDKTFKRSRNAWGYVGGGRSEVGLRKRTLALVKVDG